jgi:hypothetical protein
MADLLSSASGLLTGFRYRGKKIRQVTKGKGTRRVIHYADGSTQAVHRREIHTLAQMSGFLKYKRRYDRAKGPRKRQMLRKSEARQRAILANYIARTKQEVQLAPRAEKASLLGHLRRIGRAHYGSPLVGKRPASDLIAARPTMVHQVAKHAGVKLRSARRRKRVRK